MSRAIHDDGAVAIYQGDCRAVMAEMEPESVNCVVTSPPYWGLRDYGTATWVGGDAACDHLDPASGLSAKSTLGKNDATHPDRVIHERSNSAFTATLKQYVGACGKCGAAREDGQLGLEETPEAYVEAMVGVFREVKRVLRPDGTVWLNLGDSYNNADKWGGGGANTGKHTREPDGTPASWKAVRRRRGKLDGIKPKDLVGIPWMVAFALRADGWYLRSDIIWSKPNAMPESVTDRPTRAHEYLFLLARSPRYYYDHVAVQEVTSGHDAGNGFVRPERTSGGLANGDPTPWVTGGRRNQRDVWTVGTRPYPGAHYAVFPPDLIRPAIKAGCPEGGVVLDPFGGSGTVGLVAQQEGRRAVLIDLNGDYLRQQLARTTREFGVGGTYAREGGAEPPPAPDGLWGEP